MEGYGLTETSPVVSVAMHSNNYFKLGTVGKPISNVEVKIAEDGEILIKGPNVMQGYYKMKKQMKSIPMIGSTTGDIGEIDADGYLKITDRKKDIIVTSGGDNISPAKIENLLCNHHEIDQAFVYGDNRNYLVSLIVSK